MGSVKDLVVLQKPSKINMGIGSFVFSDRYSVFDWGEMPDSIPNKGKALCMIGAYCFEKAEEKGINTHYRGINHNGDVLRIKEITEPSNMMEVDIVRVLKPGFSNGRYDYSIFSNEKNNFLIPLEMIYRNSLPDGSSVFKRLDEGVLKIGNMNLDHYPVPGERLDEPFFDFSTKLEEEDRYLSWDEAMKISGISQDEFEKVFFKMEKVNELITEISGKSGLVNEDGKLEMAFDNKRRLMIVDVFGTPDECRFTRDGINMSKEIARQFYRGTEWENDVKYSKKEAERMGIKDWKSICRIKPDCMDCELKQIISEVYTSVANEMTGIKFFDSPPLYEVISSYKDWLDAIE